MLMVHDEKLDIKQKAYVQMGVLYTNPYGYRVVRVINMELGITDSDIAVWEGADAEATSQLLIKKQSLKLQKMLLKDARMETL
mmetsp:Transcript_38551/g.34270  ORF Transcript_38551/g.34270 Transcript_38551/m.34270 type:complete len:83 (+) Transcript_38551:269-517(+)